MGVRIDAPTLFRVDCDTDVKCFNRLYLFAADEHKAAERAEAEYGWTRDGERVLCRDHKEVIRGSEASP